MYVQNRVITICSGSVLILRRRQIWTNIYFTTIKTAIQSSKDYTDQSISDLSSVVDGILDLLEILKPTEERSSALEHMVIQNDITAPVATNANGTAILVLNSGEALVANWKE